MIPLSKCKFVAESLAKDDGIRDCLPESYGGFREDFALTGTHTTAADQTTGQDGASRAKGGPVIEIDNVTKRFADYVAVNEADFSIGSGEFFSMLGPSGCGKTTTLRMIAGFETPTEGAIRLEGADVSRVPPHKRNVNTVFQHYALFPHMTVWDNVAYGPRSLKKDKAEVKRRVDELLEIVRLTDFAKRKPAQLSGGQQQRVALARALVNYPSALLLDEPLGALDLKLRQVMQFELKRIQREVGITFVYVTHDQEEALTMSDRIAVMNAGNVDQIGTPDRDLRPARRPCSSPASSARPTCGRAGRPAAPTATSSRSRCWVRSLKARPGDTTIEPGGHATLMIRPERVRVSMDAPTGDVATVRGDGHRPHLPGSGRAAVPRRPRRLGDRRAHRTRTGSAAAAAGRPGSRQLGARAPRWCCRPPTSPPPRISRRCSTTRDGPPTDPVPLAGITKGRAAHGSRNADRSPAPGPTRRQPHLPTAVHRRRRRRAAAAGARALLPGRLRVQDQAAADTPTAHGTGRRRRTGVGQLRISNWPLYMADGFVAAFQTATGLTVDYKEDFNDNEEWFAKNKEPLSRKQDIGADLVVPTQFMAAAPRRGSAGSTRSATPACPTRRTCDPTCSTKVDPGRKSPRRTCPAWSAWPTTRPPPIGRSQGSTTCGIRPSRAGSACSPTPRTGWA